MTEASGRFVQRNSHSPFSRGAKRAHARARRTPVTVYSTCGVRGRVRLVPFPRGEKRAHTRARRTPVPIYLHVPRATVARAHLPACPCENVPGTQSCPSRVLSTLYGKSGYCKNWKKSGPNGPADGDGARGARGRKPRGADERGARTRRRSPMLRLCPAAATGRVVLACARDLHPAPRPACGSDETAQKRAMVCGDDWPRPPSANLSQQHAGRGRPDGEGG